MEIQTRDNVRTNVDILMTFKIANPERFVFTIAAPDFDQVCQATCQEALRLLVREKDSDEILDMGEAEAERLRTAIGEALARYGVEVVRVVLTHVLPPLEFVASRESRRLATLLRAEEEANHALAVLRQSDREALERQTITSRQKAIELEATNEVARLERLEGRIRDYPKAMQWDVESRRLDVAAALASNTRAMVQVGPAADVAASLLMHTVSDDGAQEPPARRHAGRHRPPAEVQPAQGLTEPRSRAVASAAVRVRPSSPWSAPHPRRGRARTPTACRVRSSHRRRPLRRLAAPAAAAPPSGGSPHVGGSSAGAGSSDVQPAVGSAPASASSGAAAITAAAPAGSGVGGRLERKYTTPRRRARAARSPTRSSRGCPGRYRVPAAGRPR